MKNEKERKINKTYLIPAHRSILYSSPSNTLLETTDAPPPTIPLKPRDSPKNILRFPQGDRKMTALQKLMKG